MTFPDSTAAWAQLTLSLMDLTSLNDQDTMQSITSLAESAHTPFGPVAALCVHPRFVETARRAAPELKIATVSNFPSGEADIATALGSTATAIQAGADEIDAVLPYRAFLEGKVDLCREILRETRELCGTNHRLKVILETGELKDPAVIRQAADLALEEGADFLKTSTGKSPVSATPEAARVLLAALRDGPPERGLKISGGVKTVSDATLYLRMAAETMGEAFLQPATFRFGASGLLNSLLTTLHGGSESAADGY